ncbi:hypothetical protein ACGFIF_25500 [Kribbella sp. NPDC049174]|uniref:hypothetical protein n=1 Tax=Kribbella sp. NPDC049174 TaxID=3364112 RepID=UPI0037148842
MGEASPEVWAEELRRAGRVVFPQRRRALTFKVVITVLPCATTGTSFTSVVEDGGVARLLAFALVASVVGCLGFIGWQAITRRPMVTVDRQGIRSGRKFMAWTDVGSIGIPHGLGFAQTLPIIPADVWAKDLTLSQENVRDVLAFARWLEDVLNEQRRLAGAFRLPPGRPG